MTWIELSLAGGCLQTARNALSKSLVGQISPTLNSWSRFAFNLPLSTLLMLGLLMWVGVPRLSPPFFAYCAATAVAQLLGNIALVSAFRHANFAETIVLHKLEVVFTALVGVLFFAEAPSSLGWVGVVLCGAGVVFMNLGRQDGPQGWRRAFHLSSGSLLALLCAVLLVLASFMLKSASAQFVLANPSVGSERFTPAVHTLFHTTWMEVVILTVALALTRPPGIPARTAPLAPHGHDRRGVLQRQLVLVLGLRPDAGRLFKSRWPDRGRPGPDPGPAGMAGTRGAAPAARGVYRPGRHRDGVARLNMGTFSVSFPSPCGDAPRLTRPP